MSHVIDKRGRRSWKAAKSSNLKIALTETDLARFEALHRHGDLSTSYLHKITEHLGRNQKATSIRLGRLFHESNTQYHGRYLTRPPRQLVTSLDSNYHEAVYSLRKPAVKALAANGVLHDNVPTTSYKDWYHDHLRACVTGSMEIATLRNPELYRYIPQHEAINRYGLQMEHNVSFSYEVENEVISADGKLNPDALFGIEYLPTNTVRWFYVEIDMGTESNEATDLKKKSHRKNILQNRKFFEGGGFKKAYPNLNGGILVLNVFTKIGKMNRVRDLAVKLSKNERGFNFMLYKQVDCSTINFKPPKVMYELFDTPWLRAGKDDLPINV